MTRLRAVVASVNHQRHRHLKDHVRKDCRDLGVVVVGRGGVAVAAGGVGDVDDE